MDVEVPETPKKRSRKSNWDPRDEITLIEEVQKREKILFGKLDGPGRTTVDKSKAWKEVTDLVNAGSTIICRDVNEIKKKYQNIKQKAKEKRSAILNPKTGGGKKPASPNASEQLLLDNLEGRPSLCGLASGIDTAAESVVDFLDDNHALHEFDLTSETTQLEHLNLMFPQTQPLPSTSTTSSTEFPLKVTSEMLLQEELINIRERRKLIKEQQQLVHLQKQHVMLKIKEKNPSFNFEHFMNEM
ncbi:myb/SANT-like DNA-binding domain-containing protein 4 [Saccostrea cucullata]|uniref:myb/SANT-like DNA-binding domain-containing protein 4 n=1 Tax=Saccostrea cuccullata TaxID=36930 RepID=UPI002ED6A33A